MSSAPLRSVAEDRRRIASVGRFSLRGVGNPQELYALRWMRRVRRAAGRSFALRPRLDAKLASEVVPRSLLENIERKEKPHAIPCPGSSNRPATSASGETEPNVSKTKRWSNYSK